MDLSSEIFIWAIIFNLIHPLTPQAVGEARMSLSVGAFGTEKFRHEMDQLAPKGFEMPVLLNLLLTAFRGAKQLMNPCSLNDFVREELPAAVSDNNLTRPLRTFPRNVVIDQVINAVTDGCNLYRSTWVLQETTNLTIFIDHNTDHLFDNTVLRNYSHFYFWADGSDISEVLFLGVIRNTDLRILGDTLAALRFLTAMGLRKHPWRFIDYENLPPSNMTHVISEVRLRTANLLKKQGLFWENQKEYIADILTASYNGPETVNEMSMFSLMVKAFSEEVRKMTSSEESKTKYDQLCAEWDEQRESTVNKVQM